jgi:hypothetical protein
MAKYIVAVREIHIQLVEVEAETEEDAKQVVRDGDGDYLDGTLEYSDTMNSETWTVDKKDDYVGSLPEDHAPNPANHGDEGDGGDESEAS